MSRWWGPVLEAYLLNLTAVEVLGAVYVSNVLTPGEISRHVRGLVGCVVGQRFDTSKHREGWLLVI